MADQRIRQIKIKTGVCKRLTKEKVYYEKEVETENKRYEKLKSEGADEHTLKKQTEVIGESQQMIPDTMRKLTTAKDELEKLLTAESDLAEAAEYKDAEKIIEEANKVLAEK